MIKIFNEIDFFLITIYFNYLPDVIYIPSDENATLLTNSLCPFKV